MAANCVKLFSPDAGRATTWYPRDGVDVQFRFSPWLQRQHSWIAAAVGVRLSMVMQPSGGAAVRVISRVVDGGGKVAPTEASDGLGLQTMPIPISVWGCKKSVASVCARMAPAFCARRWKDPTQMSGVVRRPSWAVGVEVVLDMGIAQPIWAWASQFWVGAWAFGPELWLNSVGAWFFANMFVGYNVFADASPLQGIVMM